MARKNMKTVKKEAEDKIKDGQEKIDDAKKELTDLKYPEWILTDRNGLPEYSDYGDNADRIQKYRRGISCYFLPGSSPYQSYHHDQNGRGAENADWNNEGSRLQ